MNHEAIQHTFSAALERVVEHVKSDRSVLAAVLCGSLSHDIVWQKSDIDVVFVTIDDKNVPAGSLAINADEVNVHAFLMPRAEFRRVVEGAVRNSFMHSLLAKGRLLYTHDPTIGDLCATLNVLGDRDMQLQLLRAGIYALPLIYKARKWFLTRGDLDYTALWLLYTATPLAMVEVIGARQIAGREVIPQAMSLNPKLFKTIYTDLLNTPKTKAGVKAALEAAERYIAARARTLFGAIIEHLRESGDARSCSEIETYFQRNFDVNGVTTACEYLADQGIIGKAGTPAKLTKKSNIEVQELAFFYLSPDA